MEKKERKKKSVSEKKKKKKTVSANSQKNVILGNDISGQLKTRVGDPHRRRINFYRRLIPKVMYMFIQYR